MKSKSSQKISNLKLRKCLPFLATFSLTPLHQPITNAAEVANISIDLKKEVENIRQKNFNDKENLKTPIKGTPDVKKEIKNKKTLKENPKTPIKAKPELKKEIKNEKKTKENKTPTKIKKLNPNIKKIVPNKGKIENQKKDNSKNKNIKNITNEKTIFLKNIKITGNKRFTDKKLKSFYIDLIGKDVTFTELSKATLNAQSLYKENGYITTIVLLPKQDFSGGNIKVVVVESFIEDIVVTGGTAETRDYIKYMTEKVLEDNKKNKIFKFDDLERQLLLIKKTGIGNITSTLSKGSVVGSSLLTINVGPNPLSVNVFSNTDISKNLGDYVTGFQSSFTTKEKNPVKITTLGKIGFPHDEGLLSGVLFLEKPIARKGLSFNSVYAYSLTKTQDLFPSIAGDTTNEGISEFISLGISYPFILKRNTEFGFDFTTTLQDSHQDLYQNGLLSTNVTTDKIRAFRFGLSGRKSLKNSFNTARFVYSQAFEGFNNSLSEGQQSSNVDSTPNFSTYKLDLGRQQILGKTGMQLALKASGQLATEPLPTPEKFSFGGSNFGKGFNSSNIFGDAGWAASVQLSKNIYSSKKGISISPYIWYDYGETDDLTGTKTDIREFKASTYGIGLGGNINTFANYNFSLGVPNIDNINPSKVGLDHSIFKFNLGIQF